MSYAYAHKLVQADTHPQTERRRDPDRPQVVPGGCDPTIVGRQSDEALPDSGGPGPKHRTALQDSHPDVTVS